MKKLCLLFLLLALVPSCAGQNRLYNWEQYPSSLYAYKKEPSDEKLIKHKETLIEILESSKEDNKRVPPGVYCEYGFILLKEGKNDEAAKFFDLEEKTYPESSIFMQNLKLYLKDKAPGANKKSEPDIKKISANQEIK